jgi:small subunit ribosomal protein S21
MTSYDGSAAGVLQVAETAFVLDAFGQQVSEFTPFSEDPRLETLLGRPLEVEVRDSVDKALKILKQKMSKEGILQEIKRRRYYEKPSVKRKRKMREARKRRRREAKRRIIR